MAYGYNVALFVAPNEKWSFGITYNSEVEQSVDDGEAHFVRPSAELPDTWFVDTNFSASLDLPAMTFLGFAYRPSDKFSVGGGLVHTAWSALQNILIDYKDPFLVVPGLNLTADEATKVLLWDDSWRYNIGFEHVINEKFNFQWGFIYDESPVPDETVSYLLPSNNRFLVDLGFSYQMGHWQVDGSYMYLWNRDRDIHERQIEDGVLDTEVRNGGANLIGITLSRKF